MDVMVVVVVVMVGDEVRSFFKLHLATRLDTPVLTLSFSLYPRLPSTCNLYFAPPFARARTKRRQYALIRASSAPSDFPARSVGSSGEFVYDPFLPRIARD